MTIWQWIVGFLVWLSADPAAIDLEAPKAAAAVAAARASLLVDAAPAPAPQPKPPAPTPAVCSDCNGTGWLTMPDGHRVKCPQCNGTGKPCPDGKCPPKRP
jgi:hypothetical protein